MPETELTNPSISEKNKKQIIPLVFCFNDNYSIPSSVAFYSLLENADKNNEYKIYVLTSDVSEKNKSLLIDTVNAFNNAELQFIDMKDAFNDLFTKTNSKYHFTKEMYYKLVVPDLFPQYEKIVISDSDVVFLDDISEIYNGLKTDEPYYVYASFGFQDIDEICKKNSEEWCINNYKSFSSEERKKCLATAGLMVFNLLKMREDKIEKRFKDFIYENADRVVCPEQDTINIVCYKKIKKMPLRALVAHIYYDYYKNEIREKKTAQIISSALNNPIQLHYATGSKPWLNDCAKNEIWYGYLVKTPMFKEFIKKIFNKPKIKTVLKLKIPFANTLLRLTKEKI